MLKALLEGGASEPYRFIDARVQRRSGFQFHNTQLARGTEVVLLNKVYDDDTNRKHCE